MPPKKRSLYQTVWVYYSAAVRVAECVWASFGVCVCVWECVSALSIWLCSTPGSCCSTLVLSWLCVAVTLCVFTHLCVFVLSLSASPWHRNLTSLVTIRSREMLGVPRAWHHRPDHTSISHSFIHLFPSILNPFFFVSWPNPLDYSGGWRKSERGSEDSLTTLVFSHPFIMIGCLLFSFNFSHSWFCPWLVHIVPSRMFSLLSLHPWDTLFL